MPWLGFQETDVRFDMGTNGTHPALTSTFNPGNILMRHAESTANIISPVGLHSPTQLDAADFQSLSGAMSTGFDPTLTDNPSAGSTSMLGVVPQTDITMQQPPDQQRLSRDQTPKLQFAAGYMWRQEEGSERAVHGHGHARHQSASQVYSQQQMHFQAAQQKAMLTRSLQDLTHYAAPHQQQLAEQVGLLRDEPIAINPPTVEQGMAQDTFDASLALVLDDHLSLLDDMEVVPELNEYDEMSDPALTSSVQMNEGNSIPTNTVPLGLDQPTLVGTVPVYHNIQGTTTHTHDTIIMSSDEFKEGIGNVDAGGTLFHFQGDPYYMDTLSFLDLSGNFMQSAATTMPTTGPTTTSATATSSSLPNTSFLDQQGARIYQGLVPNFHHHAQAPLPPGLNVPTATQHAQQTQHGQDQPPPQQHIIHHQHHHHHHVHLH
ncbi:hypothetical protein BGX29_001315 [Mortierella sp. GBA35]|nr:hypothetical protein BGX29_001315 [Mortierella sp. GBA35]